MKNRKLFLAAAVAVALTGCSIIPDAIVKRGADLNNKAVESAAFTLCRGASVGAMRRKFGPEEVHDLWRILKCE